MRLTLRTLLAYLDHTLDPQDEAALGEKVRNSTIATELVARIQHSLTKLRGDSPSPDAVSPNDDANAIAEYLDNTLAPELTAEVERQCLESDSHLSEVAACHQVLTIVLGEPAAIPPALRRKIYELRPPVTAAKDGGSDEAVVPVNRTGAEVRPVGPADSGVASATTRIDAEPSLNATLAAAAKTIRRNRRGPGNSTTAEPAMAGDVSRARLEAIGPLLYGGRPSRVVPYLVTLGLAAAFLFVLVQAFEPLLNANRKKLAEQQAQQQAEKEPANTAVATPPRTTEVTEPKNGNTSSTPSQTAETTQEEEVASDEVASGVVEVESDAAGTAANGADQSATTTEPPVVAEEPSSEPMESPADPSALLDAAQQTSDEATSGNQEQMPDIPVIGGVEKGSGLLLSQDSRTGAWSLVANDAPIAAGDVLLCAPTFRGRLMLDGGLELTLVGPTGLRIDRIETGRRGAGSRLFLTMDFGRIIAMATAGPVQLSIATPAASGHVVLPRPGTTAAVSVDFIRPPGTDPLNPASSRSLMRIRSVQGQVVWGPSGGASNGGAAAEIPLQTGQRHVMVVGQTPVTEVAPAAPEWLNTPVATAPSDAASARKGLMEILDSGEPLETQLRKAVGGRRQDVAALAARTLLNLGMPDVYFGPGGVLNRPDLRTHWPELVASLRAFIDRGPPSATRVAAVAGELEGDAAGKLWFILGGFSPIQLEKGDDEILVQFLDDPVMSVRVLATETLRQITGSTLSYRPDYETPSRRATGVKKWESKVRLDQIRWSEPAAAQGLPSLDAPPATAEEATAAPPPAPSAPPTNTDEEGSGT